MKTEKNESVFSRIIKKILTLLSWVFFVILILCAVVLLYYFIATKIYMVKGKGYEPKFNLYTIISPSMTPNIKVYDVIVDFNVKSPEDINIGDVITFNSDIPELAGNSITHRVIAITQDDKGMYYYQTKGDANLVEDASLVPYTDIIGKVAFKIPQLGRIQFFIASSMGWIIVVLVPALYIILKDVVKLVKMIKDPTYIPGDKKKSKNTMVAAASIGEGNYNILINSDDYISDDD